jgi:hypothetical protein
VSLVSAFRYPQGSGEGHALVTEKAIDLDQHRGVAAQKATDLRQLPADVEANEKALHLRQDELEAHLLAAPSTNWCEAAEKARYLLNLFPGSPANKQARIVGRY